MGFFTQDENTGLLDQAKDFMRYKVGPELEKPWLGEGPLPQAGYGLVQGFLPMVEQVGPAPATPTESGFRQTGDLVGFAAALAIPAGGEALAGLKVMKGLKAVQYAKAPLTFLKNNHLVTAALYGMAKNTGLDEGSPEDIAQRFKNASMTAGTMAALGWVGGKVAGRISDEMLSKALPTIAKNEAYKNMARHFISNYIIGTGLGALQPEEGLTRGQSALIGGPAFAVGMLPGMAMGYKGMREFETGKGEKSIVKVLEKAGVPEAEIKTYVRDVFGGRIKGENVGLKAQELADKYKPIPEVKSPENVLPGAQGEGKAPITGLPGEKKVITPGGVVKAQEEVTKQINEAKIKQKAEFDRNKAREIVKQSIPGIKGPALEKAIDDYLLQKKTQEKQQQAIQVKAKKKESVVNNVSKAMGVDPNEVANTHDELEGMKANHEESEVLEQQINKGSKKQIKVTDKNKAKAKRLAELNSKDSSQMTSDEFSEKYGLEKELTGNRAEKFQTENWEVQASYPIPPNMNPADLKPKLDKLADEIGKRHKVKFEVRQVGNNFEIGRMEKRETILEKGKAERAQGIRQPKIEQVPEEDKEAYHTEVRLNAKHEQNLMRAKNDIEISLGELYDTGCVKGVDDLEPGLFVVEELKIPGLKGQSPGGGGWAGMPAGTAGEAGLTIGGYGKVKAGHMNPADAIDNASVNTGVIRYINKEMLNKAAEKGVVVVDAPRPIDFKDNPKPHDVGIKYLNDDYLSGIVLVEGRVMPTQEAYWLNKIVEHNKTAEEPWFLYKVKDSEGVKEQNFIDASPVIKDMLFSVKHEVPDINTQYKTEATLAYFTKFVHELPLEGGVRANATVGDILRKAMDVTNYKTLGVKQLTPEEVAKGMKPRTPYTVAQQLNTLLSRLQAIYGPNITLKSKASDLDIVIPVAGVWESIDNLEYSGQVLQTYDNDMLVAALKGDKLRNENGKRTRTPIPLSMGNIWERITKVLNENVKEGKGGWNRTTDVPRGLSLGYESIYRQLANSQSRDADLLKQAIVKIAAAEPDVIGLKEDWKPGLTKELMDTFFGTEAKKLELLKGKKLTLASNDALVMQTIDTLRHLYELKNGVQPKWMSQADALRFVSDTLDGLKRKQAYFNDQNKVYELAWKALIKGKGGAKLEFVKLKPIKLTLEQAALRPDKYMVIDGKVYDATNVVAKYYKFTNALKESNVRQGKIAIKDKDGKITGYRFTEPAQENLNSLNNDIHLFQNIFNNIRSNMDYRAMGFTEEQWAEQTGRSYLKAMDQSYVGGEEHLDEAPSGKRAQKFESENEAERQAAYDEAGQAKYEQEQYGWGGGKKDKELPKGEVLGDEAEPVILKENIAVIDIQSGAIKELQKGDTFTPIQVVDEKYGTPVNKIKFKDGNFAFVDQGQYEKLLTLSQPASVNQDYSKHLGIAGKELHDQAISTLSMAEQIKLKAKSNWTVEDNVEFAVTQKNMLMTQIDRWALDLKDRMAKVQAKWPEMTQARWGQLAREFENMDPNNLSSYVRTDYGVEKQKLGLSELDKASPELIRYVAEAKAILRAVAQWGVEYNTLSNDIFKDNLKEAYWSDILLKPDGTYKDFPQEKGKPESSRKKIMSYEEKLKKSKEHNASLISDPASIVQRYIIDQGGGVAQNIESRILENTYLMGADVPLLVYSNKNLGLTKNEFNELYMELPGDLSGKWKRYIGKGWESPRIYAPLNEKGVPSKDAINWLEKTSTAKYSESFKYPPLNTYMRLKQLGKSMTVSNPSIAAMLGLNGIIPTYFTTYFERALKGVNPNIRMYRNMAEKKVAAEPYVRGVYSKDITYAILDDAGFIPKERLGGRAGFKQDITDIQNIMAGPEKTWGKAKNILEVFEARMHDKWGMRDFLFNWIGDLTATTWELNRARLQTQHPEWSDLRCKQVAGHMTNHAFGRLSKTAWSGFTKNALNMLMLAPMSQFANIRMVEGSLMAINPNWKIKGMQTLGVGRGFTPEENKAFGQFATKQLGMQMALRVMTGAVLAKVLTGMFPWDRKEKWDKAFNIPTGMTDSKGYEIMIDLPFFKDFRDMATLFSDPAGYAINKMDPTAKLPIELMMGGQLIFPGQPVVPFYTPGERIDQVILNIAMKKFFNFANVLKPLVPQEALNKYVNLTPREKYREVLDFIGIRTPSSAGGPGEMGARYRELQQVQQRYTAQQERLSNAARVAFINGNSTELSSILRKMYPGDPKKQLDYRKELRLKQVAPLAWQKKHLAKRVRTGVFQ